MGRIGKVIGIGCGTILAIAVLVFGIALCRVLLPKSPVTDCSKYPKIRASWPSHLVAHFPASLPPSAVFYFHPNYIQSGSSIQARVPMSQEEGVSLLTKYSSNALAIYQVYQGCVLATNGIPTTVFYTSGTTDREFPDDYCVLVLSAETHYQWANGQSAGIAVSTQRHEVVYWAESW